jgi:hypothetical protein
MSYVEINGHPVPALKKRITGGICAVDACKEKGAMTPWLSPMDKARTPRGICQAHAREVGLEPNTIAPIEIVQTAEAPTDTIDRAEIERATTEATGTLGAAKELEINSDEDLAFIAEILADIKGQNKRLEEMKKSATSPLNDSLKTIRSWFAPAQDRFAEIERILKAKIVIYHERLEIERKRAIAAIDDAATSAEIGAALAVLHSTEEPERPAGLSVRELWTYEVIDYHAVPRHFMCINEALIKHVIGSGTREIPGLRIYATKSVASKST